MLLDFLRGTSSEGNFGHIVSRSVSMLADARHSFDLATLAVLTDTAPSDVAEDIRATDRRINRAEHELRSELIVHVTVQGSADIGSVLGFALLLKKIERIGDQAKNILDLAEAGVSLRDLPESEDLLVRRQVASALFAEAGDLLGDPSTSHDAVVAFDERLHAMTDELQRRIEDCMNSDRVGREVVPLAIYYRYMRRIIANLAGVVRTSAEPIHVADDGRPDDTED